MPNSVHELERRRADIVQKIAGLGDLRPGSITTTQGKCGKPTCHCAEADHPGHGPHWRLFQQLNRDFVEVNTAICQLRSVESVAPEEKKRRKPSKRKSPKR